MQPELKGMYCCFPIAGNQPLLMLIGPLQGWLQVVSNDLHGKIGLGLQCIRYRCTLPINIFANQCQHSMLVSVGLLTCFRTACMAV